MKTIPGSVRRIQSIESNYVDAREVDIWTPGNYDPSKKYAVLYMQDGQMLFDSTKTWNHQVWGVGETMDSLLHQHKIMDAIVVGIWNNNQFRSAEYVPQDIFKFIPERRKEELEKNYFKSKPRSDDYLRFLVYELKPYIDGAYSTYPDPEHTIIMGASKGGLISLYAMCEYPQLFGAAGCLSTDWVLTVPQTPEEEKQFDLPATFRKYLDQNLPSAEDHRIYFDLGTNTLDSFYGPHQALVDSLMVSHGFTSQNWMTKVFPGDDHTEKSWGRRLHIPLEFLLGPPHH
jgi:enterochelin esterase-like enzyme